MNSERLSCDKYTLSYACSLRAREYTPLVPCRDVRVRSSDGCDLVSRRPDENFPSFISSRSSDDAQEPKRQLFAIAISQKPMRGSHMTPELTISLFTLCDLRERCRLLLATHSNEENGSHVFLLHSQQTEDAK